MLYCFSVATISNGTLNPLKEYIMERYNNRVKRNFQQISKDILGYFCTEDYLSAAMCTRSYNAYLEDLEDNRAPSNIFYIISNLKKEKLLVEKTKNYGKLVDPTSNFYRLSPNGIFHVFKEGITGYDTSLVKYYSDDKLFSLFLDPYIPIGTLPQIEDFKIVSLIYGYLTDLCKDIEKLLDDLKEIENLGGHYLSGFITMFFTNEKYKNEITGQDDFVRWISNEYSIEWDDIAKVKIKRISRFEAFEISDGFRILKLEVNTQGKKALLTENGNIVAKFLAEKHENSYYELSPFSPMTIDEYLERNLNRLPVIKRVTKLVENIIDLYSFGESTEEQKRNKELRTLSESSRFKNILGTVKHEMDERYNKIMKLYDI